MENTSVVEEKRHGWAPVNCESAREAHATAGLAEQIDGIGLSAFPDDNPPDVPAAFREE